LTITVVIPTFNAPPDRLARAVRSAAACPAVAAIIVVDDGSPNPVDTEAISAAAESGSSLHRTAIRVIRQPNAGPSAARNRGLSEAASPYVLFLDDDDELLPEGVAALPRIAKRFNAAAVQGQREELRADGVRRTFPTPPELADRPLPEPDDVFMPIALFGTPGLLVDRRRIGDLRFDEGIWIQEDRDFLRRIASVGPVCVSSQAAVLVHRVDTGSNLTSRTNLVRRIRDHIALLDRHLPTRGPATARAREHWRDSTRWLINQSAKAGVEPAHFRALIAAASARGWNTPIKARLRAAVRSILPAAPSSPRSPARTGR
jgi:glycosyltransferase involved in cell wall biosynthesis